MIITHEYAEIENSLRRTAADRIEPCDGSRKGIFGSLFYPWGLLVQAAAIIHFIRRRPDTYWIFIIIFLGALGALIYLCVEALPDLGLLRHHSRGSRAASASPNADRDSRQSLRGNFEELGDLYMDEGKLQMARTAFIKAIAARSNTLDCFYRRGVCAYILGDAEAALPDLEMAVQKDPGHDFYRAAACWPTPMRRPARRKRLKPCSARHRTLDPVGDLFELRGILAAEGRNAEARQWAQKVWIKS